MWNLKRELEKVVGMYDMAIIYVGIESLWRYFYAFVG